MGSSISPKDEIWFLRMCHHISNAVYSNWNDLSPYVTRLIGWFIGRNSKSELPTGRGLYILLYRREDQMDKRRIEWIGRGGPVEWPSWLTDLTSTNIFLLGIS